MMRERSPRRKSPQRKEQSVTFNNLSPSKRSSPARRRPRKLWTEKETEILKQSVDKYGVGKWAIIVRNEPIFTENGRTQVDLKDKWRNLTSYSKRSPSMVSRTNSRAKSPMVSLTTAKTSRRRGRTPSPMRKSEFVLYTIQGCGYCSDVRDILEKANRAYTEIKVTSKNQESVYKATDPLTKRYRYFPMIFRNGKFVGGYAELKKMSL